MQIVQKLYPPRHNWIDRVVDWNIMINEDIKKPRLINYLTILHRFRFKEDVLYPPIYRLIYNDVKCCRVLED